MTCDIIEQVGSVPFDTGRPGDLDETVAQVEKLGRRCIALEGDVRRTADMARLADAAMSEFGRIDILVNGEPLDALSMAAPLGRLLRSTQTEAGAELLMCNLLLASKGHAHFALNAATGELVLCRTAMGATRDALALAQHRQLGSRLLAAGLGPAGGFLQNQQLFQQRQNTRRIGRE